VSSPLSEYTLNFHYSTKLGQSQQYLHEILNQSQENERYEKRAWSRGTRPRPATEWRWMFDGIFPETGSDSPLLRRLNDAGLVDPGTGATFEALEKRALSYAGVSPLQASVIHSCISR
jgi:hypothetical protein